MPQPRSDRVVSLGILLGLLLALLPVGAVWADETELSAEEEERLEAIERHTERGWKAFRTGNHDEVLARMERVAKYDPENPLAPYLTARVYERTGRYADALEIAGAAVEAHPKDRRLADLRLSLLLESGQLDVAATVARAALAETPDEIVALSALAKTYEERGRRKEALAEYDKIIALYNARVRSDESEAAASIEIPHVAHAAIRATWLSPNPADDMLNPVVRLLGAYLRENPDDFDVKLQLAALRRSDRGPRGQALARKHYDEILKVNTELAEARVGRAQTDLVFYQQAKALKDLERALVSNPNYVPALSLKAAIHVGNGDYDQAEKYLARALEVNPRDKETRAVKAAYAWIRGDKPAFEKLRDEILADDATFGRVYLVCAELVGERQRRYDDAAALARKAIEIDPDDRDAYVVLGESLMNIGQTDEALKQFDIGVEKSKKYKDVRRDNWREVLTDVLPKFKVLESEHFRVRVPVSEARVMEHYLLPLLEESWDGLSEKYGFEPSSPIYVDAFDRQDDFSVRSVGTAGLPALGVCFGNVITLLGPTSLPMGRFSWSRTAWHEFAHVVTLQLSKGQVPRWLTEGLSVYEEKSRRPRWGREMEKQLFDRWRNGRLLKMGKINSAFRGPDILFAYFQGGLIAEHLQQERGFGVIPQMLARFGEDKTTAQVFKEVLDLDLAKYDEMFREYVETIVGDYRMIPTWDNESLDAFKARAKKDPTDVEAWVRLAWAHFQRRNVVDTGGALAKALALDAENSEALLLQAALAQTNNRTDLAERYYQQFLDKGEHDLRAHLFMAQRVQTQGGDGEKAIEHLEAAKRCFPRYVGRDSPYLQLAKLYRGANDMAKSIAELEAYAEIAAEDYGVRRELKAWYKRKGDQEGVARVCEEMVDITPFGANVKGGEPPDMDLHRDYAQALTALERFDEALREREVQIEMGLLLGEEQQIEADVAKDRLILGRLYLERKRPEDALEQALAALRLAPGNADALMLKQRALEAEGRR